MITCAQRGVTQVVLTGVATSAGVESTARSAYDLGYNVTLVVDAMTDRDADAHRHSVEKIFPRLGETATTDDVLKLLREAPWRCRMKINALRALRHRNFRLFFCGQSLSLIGTWMTRLATSWLVYRLTGSSLLLGVITFAGQIPTFLLAPVAGVWVDRWQRRRVLLVTQFLAALAIPHARRPDSFRAHHHSGNRRAEHFSRIDQRLRHAGAAIVPGSDGERPDRFEQCHRAQFDHGQRRASVGAGPGGNHYRGGWGRILFPDRRRELFCRHRFAAGHEDRGPGRQPNPPPACCVQLKEGWTYVSTFAPIRTVLLLFAIVSFMGVPYTVLMPVFATKILHGGPHTLGFLMGAAGVGSIIAAISLAARKSVRGLYRVIPTVAALFGGGLIAFSFSRNYWLSLALMGVTGFGMMQFAPPATPSSKPSSKRTSAAA